jgi:hypothetical protein
MNSHSDKTLQLRNELFERINSTNDAHADCTSDVSFLNSDDLILLADVLKKKSIGSLSLTGHEMNENTIEGFKKIILSNDQLKEIWLDYCKITDSFIKLLVSDDKVKARLQTVDLRLDNNKISATGLSLANDYMSPASVLSILMTNPIQDKELSEKCRVEALAKLKDLKASAEEKTVNPANKLNEDQAIEQVVHIVSNVMRDQASNPEKVERFSKKLGTALNKLGIDFHSDEEKDFQPTSKQTPRLF